MTAAIISSLTLVLGSPSPLSKDMFFHQLSFSIAVGLAVVKKQKQNAKQVFW
jgi:hypothetical protein